MSKEAEMISAIGELHSRFVAKADDRIKRAAAAVVHARRHSNDWDELKNAIGDLEEALSAAGVAT